MPALGSAGPALATAMRIVFFQHDDAVEGLGEHLRRGDPRNAAADDHRGPTTTPADIGDVDGGVIEVNGTAAPRRSTGDELLVVKTDAMEPVAVQPSSGGFDHPGRTTQIDVGIAAGQHCLVQQIGDKAGRSVPARVRLRDDDVHLHGGHPLGQRVEFVELAQVFAGGHAVEHRDGMGGIGGQALRHREDRRQAGAAGDQDYRPNDGAQAESAFTASHGDMVTGPSAVAQIVRHHAVRQQPDDEFQLPASVGGMGVGVVAPGVGARHLKLGELARLVTQRPGLR